MIMKETFILFIDAIVYAIIFTLATKILEHLKIDFNYIYVIIFTLIIFVFGKLSLRRFIYKIEGKID